MIGFARLAAFAVAALSGAAGLAAAASDRDAGRVVVVPISGTVDAGMAHLVERAVAEANAGHAAALVLDVNTPGGLVSAAFEIRDAMLAAKVPTVAYISQRAYSAGALITLSARTIVMAPGASIGAAEPIPNDPKHVSALRAEFASTATRNHRDATLAAAMVDKSVDAPAYKKAGAILSLTAQEAKRARVADAVAPTLDAALAFAGVHGTVVNAAYTWGESLARFATSPEVSGILLSLGVLGLIIEMQTLHGIAGALGVTSLALFFGTHVYAGFSDGIVIALAIVGILGILFELHVFPGHGVGGLLGAIALLAAVFLAFGVAFIFIAVQALSIAIVLSAVFIALSTRVFPESAFFRRITFADAQGPDYVASRDFTSLLGHTGIATSYLRPAGVAQVGGERVDVLTEGDFVPAGSVVRVSRVQGSRVFVTAVSEEGQLS
ncbi:MAG: NfeD family protein [Vulcanimicrobiaceae bacterium]